MTSYRCQYCDDVVGMTGPEAYRFKQRSPVEAVQYIEDKYTTLRFTFKTDLKKGGRYVEIIEPESKVMLNQARYLNLIKASKAFFSLWRPLINEFTLLTDPLTAVFIGMEDNPMDYKILEELRIPELKTIANVVFLECSSNLNKILDILGKVDLQSIGIRGSWMSFDHTIDHNAKHSVRTLAIADIDSMENIDGLLQYFDYLYECLAENPLHVADKCEAVVRAHMTNWNYIEAVTVGYPVTDELIEIIKTKKDCRTVAVRVETKKDAYMVMKMYMECKQLIPLQGYHNSSSGPNTNLRRHISMWIAMYGRQVKNLRMVVDKDRLFDEGLGLPEGVFRGKKTIEPARINPMLITRMNELLES